MLPKKSFISIISFASMAFNSEANDADMLKACNVRLYHEVGENPNAIIDVDIRRGKISAEIINGTKLDLTSIRFYMKQHGDIEEYNAYCYSNRSGQIVIFRTQVDPIQSKIFVSGGQAQLNACYSAHAAQVCPTLSMMNETGHSLSSMPGIQVNPINQNDKRRASPPCIQGMSFAMSDADSGMLCIEAWERYGCYGSDMPGLLIEKNFGKTWPGAYCEFNPMAFTITD